MSHVADVRLKVHDLDALAEAAVACGLEFRRGKTRQAWWGRFVGDSTPPAGRDPKDYGKCLHALGRAGTRPQDGRGGEYEIGVVAALDGDGYDLLLDTYGPGQRIVAACGGRNLDRLRREYTVASIGRRATAALAREGFTMTRETLPSNPNRVRLRFVRR